MAANNMVFSPMLVHSQLNRLQRQLKQELLALEKELTNLPDGTLYIYKRHKWFTFYSRTNGVTRSISSDKDLVYKLARRQFVTLLTRLIHDYLYEPCGDYASIAIDSFISDVNSLISKFENAGLDVDRIIMSKNQLIWSSKRESEKITFQEDLKYPTKGRIYMRTKSEQTLGNLLESVHIPYRYETTLTIRGIDYHPDFVIMLPNGRLIIIEHAGRTDLRKYNEDLLSRLEAYNHIGLLIGRDVFLTFEQDTRDDVILKEVLFQAMTSTPSDNKYLKQIAISAGCVFS